MTVMNSEKNLVVKYRFPFYLSLIVWGFGWLILFKILSIPGPFPRQSPGYWFDIILWGLIIIFNGFLGPVAAVNFSTIIFIQGEVLKISKWFGFVKRSYMQKDIVNFKISHGEKNNKATIIFNDGNKLSISAYAINYDLFCAQFKQDSVKSKNI